MLSFNEDFLHFVWQYKLLKPQALLTCSGKGMTILKPGELNKDAGPDFFNASVRINDLVLVGNIEIHIKTSDWLKHKHQQDNNYNHLILHVVYEHDLDLHQNITNNVEVLEIKNLLTQETINNYADLYESRNKLPCSTQLGSVNELKFVAWIERMAIERLEDKVKRVDALFNSFNSDYTQTFYTLLVRNFGFKVNALPFELLARQVPVTLLLKHSDNLIQLESLLMGMAGMLDGYFEDKYIKTLQNEFEYLKTKYHLIPLKKELFKSSRMRPANFPQLRLAQLATLIHTQRQVFMSPYSHLEVEELKEILKVKPGNYWKNHYLADGKVTKEELSLGDTSAEIIIINTFAPFFFFYSKKTGKTEFFDSSLNLLSLCKFERNAKTRLFAAKKDCLKSAADSQALINLYDLYCLGKKCLDCGIGAAILKHT